MYWYGCCCTNKDSWLWFCFYFWPGCNHLNACLWYLLFLWICRNFCVVLNRIDHMFDRSIGNSDQDWELSWFTDQIRISIPYLKCWKLVVTSHTSLILMFPWIHPVGCDDGSSRGRVCSRQGTERNWLKLPVSLVTKYCPTSTTRINPASLQNLLTLFSNESDSTCWMYCCHIIWSFMGFSFCKGASDLTSPRTIDWPIKISGSPDRSWGLSNSSHMAATAP